MIYEVGNVMVCLPNIGLRMRRYLSRPQQLMLTTSVLCMLTASSILLAGCATVAQVTNLAEAPCNASFEGALSSILTEQGEKKDIADSLAHRTYLMLSSAELGPRPFVVPSPSGTDYFLFIQKKPESCLLRLYGRQKGFMSYTNNLTYISTRELSGCSCQE